MPVSEAEFARAARMVPRNLPRKKSGGMDDSMKKEFSERHRLLKGELDVRKVFHKKHGLPWSEELEESDLFKVHMK